MIDQLGKVLPRTIAAIEEASDGNRPILFRNVYIKDGFWKILYQSGAEWHFTYALPGEENEDKMLVVTM